MLFDTTIDSLVASHVIPALTAAGISPEAFDWVFVSHSDLDHSGGNSAVRALAPRALFCCHELDHAMIADAEALIQDRYRCYAADHGIDESPESLSWLRANVRHVPIDLQLRGGEVVSLDDDFQLEVLHVPGHSRGHIALYDARRRVLLAQDCVLGCAVPTNNGHPAFPPTYRYVDDYLATITRLEELPIDILLTAHYAPMLNSSAVRAFLAKSRRFVESADSIVLETLTSIRAPLTMREIIALLSPQLGMWPEAAADFLVWPLTGHLERLEARRLVSRSRRDGLTAYDLNRH